MFTWFFQSGQIHNYDDVAKSDIAQFARFHRGMLDGGVYLPPSQFEAAFLGIAHKAGDIEQTIDVARHTFATLTQTAATSL
jgi:glutamate-1-semialdehyde 2,1-aminomutase